MCTSGTPHPRSHVSAVPPVGASHPPGVHGAATACRPAVVFLVRLSRFALPRFFLSTSPCLVSTGHGIVCWLACACFLPLPCRVSSWSLLWIQVPSRPGNSPCAQAVSLACVRLGLVWQHGAENLAGVAFIKLLGPLCQEVRSLGLERCFPGPCVSPVC